MRIRRVVAAALALALCGPLDGSAQDLISIWREPGEVGFDFSGLWRDRDQAPLSERLGYRESVTIKVAGAAIAPGIVDFDVAFIPVFTQSSEGDVSSVDARSLGYEVGVGVMKASRLSLDVTANRVETVTEQSLGADGRMKLTSLAAVLRWSNRALPMTLSYSDRYRRNVWQPLALPQPTRTVQDVQRLRFLAESSKTSLSVERSRFRNPVNNSGFRELRSDLRHRLRWGKGSSLNSQFRYLNHADDGRDIPSFQRLVWSQRARLQHTEKIRSDFGYGVQSLDARSGSSRTVLTNVSSLYDVLPQLFVGAGGYGRWSRFDEDRLSVLGVTSQAGLTVSLPAGLQVSASGSAGYERFRSEGEDAWIDVIDEVHVLDSSLSFRLDQSFVDIASLIVSDASGTEIFEENVDYRVVETGLFAEVFVFPGGRIEPADSLLVDYRYYRNTVGSQPDVLLASYGGTVSWHGLSGLYRRNLRDPVSKEAFDVSAGLLDTEMLGGRLLRRTFLGTLQILAQRRHFRQQDIRTQTEELSGSLTFGLGARAVGSLRSMARENRTDGQRLRVYTAGATTSVQASRSLRIQARANAWRWEPKNVEPQDLLGGGISVFWRIALTTVEMRYDYNRIALVPGQEEDRNQLIVRLSRRF